MNEAQTYDACLEKMAALVERTYIAKQRMLDAKFPAPMMESINKVVAEAEKAMKHLVAQRLKVI